MKRAKRLTKRQRKQEKDTRQTGGLDAIGPGTDVLVRDLGRFGEARLYMDRDSAHPLVIVMADPSHVSQAVKRIMAGQPGASIDDLLTPVGYAQALAGAAYVAFQHGVRFFGVEMDGDWRAAHATQAGQSALLRSLDNGDMTILRKSARGLEWDAWLSVALGNRWSEVAMVGVDSTALRQRIDDRRDDRAATAELEQLLRTEPRLREVADAGMSLASTERRFAMKYGIDNYPKSLSCSEREELDAARKRDERANRGIPAQLVAEYRNALARPLVRQAQEADETLVPRNRHMVETLDRHIRERGLRRAGIVVGQAHAFKEPWEFYEGSIVTLLAQKGYGVLVFNPRPAPAG